MLAGSLLEAVISISLEGLVMALITSSLVTTLSIARLASELGQQLVRNRQLERLLDAATAPLGRQSRQHQAVVAASPRRVIIEADLDGNGYIDTHSREHSAFEIALSPPRIVHRIGRQAMTIDELSASASRFRFYDSNGKLTTDPTAVALLAVPTAQSVLYAALEQTPP